MEREQLCARQRVVLRALLHPARAASEGALKSEADIAELLETKAETSAVHRAPEVALDAMLVG
jgi:hypothetical protein